MPRAAYGLWNPVSGRVGSLRRRAVGPVVGGHDHNATRECGMQALVAMPAVGVPFAIDNELYRVATSVRPHLQEPKQDTIHSAPRD